MDSQSRPAAQRRSYTYRGVEVPDRIVVGKNGAYWRDFGEFYSMCPTSTDNDPVDVVAVYELVLTPGMREADQGSGRDASAADVDGAESPSGPRGHHESVGERQGRQPAPNDPAAYQPVPREEWEWFGSPLHLIVARDCRFHLATLVGPWVVSTVGEWLPDSTSWDSYASGRGVIIEGRGDARRSDFLRKVGFIEIGHGRKYETMVFRVAKERCDEEGCECEGSPRIEEWGELDSDCYNDARSARGGHMAMCEKWATRAPESGPAWEDEEDD